MSRFEWLNAFREWPGGNTSAKAVGFVLWSHADKRGWCNPSTGKIAGGASIKSDSTVRKATEALEEAGWLRREKVHHPRGFCYEYHLEIPAGASVENPVENFPEGVNDSPLVTNKGSMVDPQGVNDSPHKGSMVDPQQTKNRPMNKNPCSVVGTEIDTIRKLLKIEGRNDLATDQELVAWMCSQSSSRSAVAKATLEAVQYRTSPKQWRQIFLDRLAKHQPVY